MWLQSDLVIGMIVDLEVKVVRMKHVVTMRFWLRGGVSGGHKGLD